MSLQNLDSINFLKTASVEDGGTDDDTTPPPKAGDTPPTKPNKPAKDEQAAELRKQRDAFKAEKEKLAKELEEYRGKTAHVEELTPIAEYIKTKMGDITPENVSKFIEKNRDRKKKLEELDGKYKEKDQTLKEISLVHSDEWKERYAIPLSQKREALYTLIAPVNADGEVKHKPLIDGLFDELVKMDDKGTPLTSTQIKAKLQLFVKKYQEATSEEFEVPSISEVTNSVHTLIKSYKDSLEARNNWEVTKENIAKERELAASEKNKKLVELELEKRSNLTKDFVKNFDVTSLSDVLTAEEFAEVATSVNARLSEVMTGKGQIGYAEIIEKMSKAEIHEKLVTRIKALEKELAQEQKKNKGGLSRSADDIRTRQTKDGEEAKVDPGNILGFVKG